MNRETGGAREPNAAHAGEAARAAPPRLTGWHVLAIAAPVVISNASVPLQGAVDTIIIGNLGEVAPLAAVGIAAQIFSLLLGSFNFLQIGVSGLSAQALGRRAMDETATIFTRGLLLAFAIGALMILGQSAIAWAGLAMFEGGAETEAMAARYIAIRIWGAPAELGVYVLFGWFAGQGLTRNLVTIQLVAAALNVALNCLFVLGLGWGVEGVALGTAIASYGGLGFGLWLARRRIRAAAPAWRPERGDLLDQAALARLFKLNRDIFIRTFLLLAAFAWMARLGSLQGDAILAANVVLWQFFLVSAYGLDGFAIAAETLTGQAIGARDRRRFDRAVWLTTLWSFGLAAAASIVFLAASGAIIDLFSTAPEVREIARRYALWACLIPLMGVAAFELDGIFIGATASREMRDSMIVSSAIFFPLSYALMSAFGNHGMWAAVWIWLLVRAATLAVKLPALRERATDPV
ncbi:MAG: MATE family efflux transporter [Pseudomonadota bacterium]